MAMDDKIDEFALYELLKTFECPCNWNFPDSIFSHEDMIVNKMKQLVSKLIVRETTELPPNEFQWRRYVFLVALSYFYSKVERRDQAMEMVDKALSTIEATEIKDTFFKLHKSSFFHVVLAMKARYYFENGDCVNAKKTAEKVTSLSKMSNVEKAALYGIKASVFNEFGSDSSFFILEDIREAVRLNPDEAEWSFLLGKVLRRIRKLAAFFEIPEKEEITALQNAYAKNKCSAYCLFLAISYKELSTKLFQKCGMERFGDKIRGLNENALKLFREALTYDDLSATAVAKISRGFAELPFPFKDVEKAKELALKSVEMEPTNCLTLHTLALHYERHDLDFDKALEYNAKALQYGSYGSGMDIIKINLRKDPNYDPMPVLMELKEKFTGEGHLNETIMQEGCYYLVVKGDLDKALEIFMKIIEKNPKLHQMNVCKPVWIQVKAPFSIFELLYHELKSSRNKNKSTFYMEALMKIKQLHPELFDKEVDENFLDNLKKESEEIVKKYANKKPTRNNFNHYQPRGGVHQNNRTDNRESRSNNWRDSRQNDGRNSFGEKRYDHSRHQQNRNNENYNRYSARRSYDNQDENSRFDNRNLPHNKSNDRSCPSINRNNLNKPNDGTGRNKSQERNRRDKSKENLPNKSSVSKLNQKKENERQSQNISENINKNSGEEKGESSQREKSFVRKEINKDKNILSSNDIELKMDGNKTETELRTVGVKLEVKDNKARDDFVEAVDFVQSEEENNSDEDEYQKKMNSKMTRQKFLEHIAQLSEKVKQQTLLEPKQKISSTVEEKQRSTETPTSSMLSTEPDVENSSAPEVAESNLVESVPSNSHSVESTFIESNADHIANEFSKLDLVVKKNEVDKECEETITDEGTNDEKLNDPESVIREQLKLLSKEQVDGLLKAVLKADKKKKKAKKPTKNQGEEQTEEASDISSLPPPKISIRTAGNQAIRQPTGPSENNFALRKK